MSPTDAESPGNPSNPQQPYGQPQYPAPPQQPYGQPQYPAAPQAPAQPQYASPQSGGVRQPTPYTAYAGLQPAQTEQQFAAQPRSAYGGPPRQKSPILGVVSLALVLICLGVALWAMGPMADVISQAILASRNGKVDNAALSTALEQYAAGPLVAIQVASFIGMASAVLGLISAIIARGRAAGVFAFIIGLLAPVIYFAYGVILILPAARTIH